MSALTLLAAGIWNLEFYCHLPVLIVVISLVYSATRYEHWAHIWREAIRWMLRMAVFLLVIVMALYVLDWWI